MHYFHQWWQEASPEQREQARTLIANGQMQFAVGGWVMPDEAIVDYTDLIETMTLGHEFIFDTFGVRPRYGFQARQPRPCPLHCFASGHQEPRRTPAAPPPDPLFPPADMTAAP